MHIPDASRDARFADNPLVTGELGIRFYAGAPIQGPSGHTLGAICIIDRVPREVSQTELEQLRHLAIGVENAIRLHASAVELQKLALTDFVTELPNRAAFNHRLRSALTPRADSMAPGVGLLFLDLDGFKAINDLFGHAGGDAALAEVARRLRSITRQCDMVSRFGGDEFCILVEDVREQGDLYELAQRVHTALAEPFTLEHQVVPLRTSIGVAVSPSNGTNIEVLMRKADAALYSAKRAGRGTTRFATARPSQDSNVTTGRGELEKMLRDALLPPGHEPFRLALQPIYRSYTGLLAGFEALVRWPDAIGRSIASSEFIRAAEATGLVIHLDRWVLDQACREVANWPSHLQISSNLSAANFFGGDLVRDVQATLAKHRVAPSRLKLEVTETVLLHDPGRVRTTIAALRELGVQVILDDFGAGHSSLGYLRDYSFDGLKIDRSFTAMIETDPQSQAFVYAIIEMARALGIETTAEGVETEGQRQILQNKQVTLLQGYLLGRPVGSAVAAALVQKQTMPFPAPLRPSAQSSDKNRPELSYAAPY
jgi:diguanylate cyclase (GGDEF)-like protein